jgi:hypothetical protein
MKVFKNVLFVALGFLIASLTISLTSVGAKVSEEIGRVIIENNSKNPIPIVSRESLKVKGEVKIDGNPEVKLDGDTKIKIESVDKPVNVQFDKNAEMPETNIFKTGRNYGITITGETAKRCNVDKINGTWIYCKQKNSEGEIVGWVNTTQVALVTDSES